MIVSLKLLCAYFLFYFVSNHILRIVMPNHQNKLKRTEWGSTRGPNGLRRNGYSASGHQSCRCRCWLPLRARIGNQMSTEQGKIRKRAGVVTPKPCLFFAAVTPTTPTCADLVDLRGLYCLSL